MTEYITKIQNNESYREYKFVKITGYSSKEIIELIKKLDIYNDKNNLMLIDEFISELYEDLNTICSNYQFVDFIKKLFTQNDYENTLSYDIIFNQLFTLGSMFYDSLDSYINFFELNNEQLTKILVKYSNIKLTDKNIPLDSKTKIILSDKNFNLSNVIIRKLINTICSSHYNKIIESLNKITQSKFELILEFTEKTNKYLKCLLYEYKHNIKFDKDNFSLPKIYDELINKIEINFMDYIKSTNHILFILIKLLITNNVFNDFNEILDIIYSRSNIPVITLISILRPELLDINLSQLKKIIYYGRYDVFELLYFHIPYKILPILKESNPLDFRGIEINYSDDIHGGSNWGNDENDRSIVGKKNHNSLIGLIFGIAGEKKYTHICWTDEIKKHWINCAIEYKKYSHVSQDDAYFISYNELVEMIGLKFDFTNKESIKEHINLFGRENTWDLIKSTSDDNFLDLLFD